MSGINLTYLLSDALATEWMMTLEGCKALKQIYFDALKQKESGSLRASDIEALWAKHEAEGLGEVMHMLRPEDSHMAVSTEPLKGANYTSTYKGIAIIDVIGPIVPRVRGMSSGSVGAQQIKNDFITAFESDDIKAILFNVDSPGGDARGISELAQTIKKARKKNTKWIYAYAAGWMASAAYFISAASHRIVANDWASVGSIGVVIGVPPQMPGDNIEFVSTTSPYKRPDVSTDEGRDVYQKKADYLGMLFIEAIADLRGVPKEKVVSDFGKGNTLVGKQAKTAGLVDAIGTFDSTLHSLVTSRSPAGPTPQETDAETKSLSRRSESMVQEFGAAGLLLYQRAIDTGLIAEESIESIFADDTANNLSKRNTSNIGGRKMADDKSNIRTKVREFIQSFGKDDRAIALEELNASDGSDNGDGKDKPSATVPPPASAVPPPAQVSNEVQTLQDQLKATNEKAEALERKMAAQEAAERKKDAETFVGQLVIGRSLMPAKMEEFERLYIQAAEDDVVNPLQSGSRVENIKSACEGLPKHTLTTEYLQTDLPPGSMVLNPDANNQEAQLKADEERSRNWAKRQNQGQARGQLAEVK